MPMKPLIATGAAAIAAVACAPTVKLQAPDKPIQINMDVKLKIEGEVKVKIDREIDDAIAKNPDLF